MSTTTTQENYTCPSPPPVVLQDAPSPCSLHVEDQEATLQDNNCPELPPSSPDVGPALAIRSSPTLAHQDATLVSSPGATSDACGFSEDHPKDATLPMSVKATVEIPRLHEAPSCHKVEVLRTVGMFKSGNIGLGMYLLL